MSINMNNKVLGLIQNKSQIIQRTQEWHDERKKLITATDAASALEANPYKTKVELLYNKCEPYVETSSVATNWGTKYEPVAIQLYEKFENDKYIKEYEEITKILLEKCFVHYHIL